MDPKPIIGVRHAVLKVRDLDKCKAFYCGVLGMKVGKEDPERGMFLRFGDYHHDIALFKVGPDADPPKQNQVGLAHVALVVDSLDTVKLWYERCKAMGVDIDHTTDHNITSSLYIKDPEGNTLEIYCDNNAYDWREEGMGFMAKPFDFEKVPMPVGA
jgi:catechol 2,3-dioxygenase